jgi:hypothetical protein
VLVRELGSKANKGRHLIVDATAHSNLSNKVEIRRFADELIAVTGLHKEHDWLKVFPNGHRPWWQPWKKRHPTSFGPGITYSAVLSESHLAIHTVPEEQYIHLDLFSCREFGVEAVFNLMRRSFEIIAWTQRCLIYR